MGELLVLSALFLAFINGANDNMKGVATLYGSGSLSYRGALSLATLSTAMGSLLSVPLAMGLVRVFSAKGLVPENVLDASFLASVALGAAVTVLVATRVGLPVSTTHALVGALAGAGIVAAGPEVNFAALGGLVLLPLLASPLMALLLARGTYRISRDAGERLGVEMTSCVCVGEEWVPVGSPAAVAQLQLTVGVGNDSECRDRYVGRIAGVSAQRLVSAGHFVSAGLVGLARGMNDTPKILGLIVGASVLSPLHGALAITVAMALGGLFAGRRVAVTMAKRITPLTPGQGLAGNLATSFLVIVATRFGLPVSTTHVSTGGIFGVGSATGQLRRGTAATIVLAWVVTLPLAALLGAAAWQMLS